MNAKLNALIQKEVGEDVGQMLPGGWTVAGRGDGFARTAVERKDGGAEGDRTLDLRIANATLSQLSYRPTRKARDSSIAARGVNLRPYGARRAACAG